MSYVTLSQTAYTVVCCVAEVILYEQPYVVLHCICAVLPVIF